MLHPVISIFLNIESTLWFCAISHTSVQKKCALRSFMYIFLCKRLLWFDAVASNAARKEI